jgi:quaternary ammonium compound-resistance protein SugE
MAWLMLLIAGVLEIGWAVGLKYADGYTRPGPSVLTVTAMVLSMVLLAMATRTLPIGTAYAVWTGIGAAGTALLGIWLFQESASFARLFCIALIIAGVVGLKVVSH